MLRRIAGVVESITAERPGAQELLVRVDTPADSEEGDLRPALNLTTLAGRIAVGERVLLNTVAVEMSLGTGGQDFVVTGLERSGERETPPGHILKMRYTPLQVPVLAVEAPESPHHDAIRLFAGLDDLPVVCAELHSQLPAICAAAHWGTERHGGVRPPRIAYIMTDGAALPMALSRLVPELKARGLLTATITTGQAFGGDYEAVNLYSALAAAQAVVNADIIVVGQGPGTVGTGTALGFSGVDQGLAINAAASLGGMPIAVARISFADARRRHTGLSHHTVTVLTRIARAPALLPLPRLTPEQNRELTAMLDESGLAETHDPITIDADQALQALESWGLSVTTMGRSLTEERPFFLAAAAAGLLAAQLVESRIG
ncbi:MAG: hypothetical protein JWL77_2494 [Chthonomonadaceae bacterium]|nr:hypothetical protein [Chthonomonadaceae bacterium]